MTSARAELLARLRDRAARLGDAPLVVAGDTVTGARELLARTEAKVRALGELGVGPGALVGTVAGPPAEFISDVFAIIEAGGVAVPLSRKLTRWELDRLQEGCPLDFLAAPPESPLTLAGPVTGCGDRALSRGPGRIRPAFAEAATAQLTSGTTGRPRVALRPAAALLAEADHYRDALRLTPRTTLLCPVPLQHAYGFGLCALAAPLAGAPVRQLPPDRPRMLLRELAAGDVALFVGVPPMLRLLAKSARGPVPAGRPVGFLSAGMALDAHTAEQVAVRLGGNVGEVYGTTETGPICVRAPRPWRPGLRRPGVPLPGVKVTLAPVPGDAPEAGAGTGSGDATRADATGPRDATGPGAGPGAGTGLVTVESPSMMLGYADGDAVDTGPSRGGFTTGDLARWEGDDLVLAGRLSTCINVAGAKVSPEEVEAVLLAWPEVASCLVTGVPDPVLGQRVSATVTPETVDLAALDRFCRERLSDSRTPHTFAAVAELPTTETGKVIRPRNDQ
ncbi:acyl--CoA ligase [Streptomyces pactum]|uniref:Acyl--CoA ligase n=1 Tax=Streptomyces pactum TaxID=68249 RepID=B7TWM6_9ACTN|nr:class I adenylate-forming enzyme family protein [Streptomyces pactum]ACJ24877.1 putative AMP-forming acyl-CoA synthetase [Streptomyces pactum]MBH5336242.1 acyl--CoA ligase [Streptomyces pactum]